MPFTLSHAALVLPATCLPKRTYSLTGLIVGSFVPDFEYFIRMKDLSIYSHTWLGVLWFDLPLGILLSFLYHYVVRDALLENLPRSLSQRCTEFRHLNWFEYFKAHWFIVSASVVVGAASHIFWDSFTHGNGYFVQLIPLLKEQMTILGDSIPYYNILQHLSTLIGGIVLGFAIYKLPRNLQAKKNANVSYWLMVVTVSFILFTLKLWFGFNYRSFDQTIINVISCGIMGLILTPILLPKHL
jgi:hypothetical protein